jgi:hypothetical protein
MFENMVMSTSDLAETKPVQLPCKGLEIGMFEI